MKSCSRFVCALAALLLLTGLSPAVAAGTVALFSNYGPGDTYDGSWGWGIKGSAASGGYRAQAQRFTPATTAYLSSIEVSLFRSSGSGRSNFLLVEDSGGYPTGSLIESFSNVLYSSHRNLVSVEQPLLQAGVTYWLRAEPYDSTTISGWYANNQGAATTFGYSFTPGGWDIMPPPAPADGVFRINAVPVPEPQTLALCLMGAGLWAIGRRKERRVP